MANENFPHLSKSQIIGRDAEKIFEGILPSSEWIDTKIPQEKDFGIDYRLEYVKDGQVKGCEVLVQLKGFRQIPSKGIRLSIATSTLHYWKQKINPVLIVAVDCTNRKAYFTWFDKTIEVNPRQKTQTIHVPIDNELDRYTLTVSVKENPDREEVEILKIFFKEESEWFENRIRCWKKLEGHENVPPSESYERYVNSSINLDEFVKKATSEQLNHNFFSKILKTAANICKTAHEKSIYLQTLPLRNFLCESDKVLLTGFDTAIDAKTNPKTIEYWRRFSKDWYDIAPELKINNPNPLADIYALGVLLKQLHRENTRPLNNLNDPWACLAFHCLSEDPNLRFQSMDHFLTFFESWIINKKTIHPIIVPVPENNPGFWMGKYPVSNFEYDNFCREWNYPRPQHHKNYENLYSRLDAPWCPVVDINLVDAHEYCTWLTKETGEIWRLPTETEWIRAAVLDRAFTEGNEKLFPWGYENPELSQSNCKQHPFHRANYENHYGGPTVVGAFNKGCSATGCYDMAGNVWEWCTDYLSPNKPLRILKGGSYYFESNDMCVINKRGILMTYRSPHVGFRVLKEGMK